MLARFWASTDTLLEALAWVAVKPANINADNDTNDPAAEIALIKPAATAAINTIITLIGSSTAANINSGTYNITLIRVFGYR